MKRDLNLMVKRKTDVKAAKNILYALLVLAILGALFFAATTIPDIIKTQALAEKTNLEQQLAALSDTKEKFETGTKIKAELLERVSLVKELDGNKKDVYTMLDFVEKECPKEITLFAVKFSAEILELDGYAGTDPDLSRFVTGLRKNPDFKTVLVQQTLYEKKNDKQNFIITIVFVQPLKAEPITVEKQDPNKAAESSASPAPTATPAAK